MTNTLLRASTACIRLITVILIAAFPGHIFAQNDASAHTFVGNAPMEMFFVPSGMCMADSEQTTLKNFYISKQPIMWQLWNEIMGTSSGGVTSDSLPVINVSRDEVELFILWFNQKSGLQFRLPTTMEWTCAVRTGFHHDDGHALCSDGGDASAGFRLVMDDPREVRTAEVIEKADQAGVAADSTRKEERESLFLQKSLAQQLRAERQQTRQNRRKALLPSVFCTLNAAYTFMPQWSVGFKVGTMRVVGWYFSFMTNFHYKGAFDPFQPNGHYVLTGASKTSYLGAQLGLVVRPCRLLSIHIGAGFGYRALKFESDQGWHSYPKRTYYGPTAAAGLIFHVKNMVLSAEVTSMAYNLNTLNEMHYALGVRMGVGFCIPYHHDVKLKIKDERILVH